MLPRLVLLAAALALLGACAMTSPDARSANTRAWAAQHGWNGLLLPGMGFDVQAFVPAGLERTARLTVYIEGDGLAWLDRHTPSFAPTPLDPLGLRLAMADAGAGAVHLARPCQYTRGPAFKGCHPRYWGSDRFAPEVLRAMEAAVEQLKRRYGAHELVLVGYSGGGAIGALLAARRSDVVALVTVAGTLDTEGWTRQQRLSPLSGSLNPKDVAPQLARVPQWHFVGGRDDTVPPSVLAGFLDGVTDRERRNTPPPVVHVEADFDHRCCWAQAWPVLSRRFAAPAAGR